MVSLVRSLQEAGQEVPKEIYKYPLVTKKKTSKVSKVDWLIG